MVKPTELFHPDGRLKGVALLEPSGRRGPAISIILKGANGTLNTSITIREGNLTAAWNKVVSRIAAVLSISEKTKLYKQMQDASVLFAAHYKLKVTQVAYDKIV